MSLKACLPGLVADGKIDQERADRLSALYDELQAEYRASMSDADAAAKASNAALDAFEFEATAKRGMAARQMAVQVEALKARGSYRGGPDDPRWAAALIDRDDRAGYSNVEGRRKAIVGRAHRQLAGILTNFRRNVLGVVRHQALLAEVRRAAFGEDTGNLAARELAEAWNGTAEDLRQRYNRAAGFVAIDKLQRWGAPQSHDSARVRAAGFDAWRAEIFPRLDRERMIDKTTGAPFSDDGLERALHQVFETIRTEGWNTRDPAAGGGTGPLALRRADPRFLVFKSADDWAGYADKFANPDFFGVMMGHVSGMARDIAAMEILGPRPEATLSWIKGVVEQRAARDLSPGTKGVDRARKTANKVDALWNEYRGNNSIPNDTRIANVSATIRNFEVMSKLGSALLAALPDLGTASTTAMFNGLPFTKSMMAFVKLLNPLDASHREIALQLSLGAESWASHGLAAMRGFSSETGAEVSGRVAESVLRLSGLNTWTEGGQWASGMMLFGHMASERGSAFDKLSTGFRGLLERHGIDAAAWDSIRATEPRKAGGTAYLFPQDVADQHLGDRLIEIYATERDNATIVADLNTRAVMHRITAKGTVAGELASQALLFKSFGVAMIGVHAKRIMAMADWKSRISYGAHALVVLTVLGAASVQLREIAKGRDMRNMDPTTEEGRAFWGAAFFQGGGFGLAGDAFKLAIDPRVEGGIAEWLAGPAIGDAGKTLGVVSAEARKVFGWHKPTEHPNPGAKLVKLLQSATPAGNLWYLRLAYQRYVLDTLSQVADPNYRKSWTRMEKAARDQGSDYWWRPGEHAPDRAPELHTETESR